MTRLQKKKISDEVVLTSWIEDSSRSKSREEMANLFKLSLADRIKRKTTLDPKLPTFELAIIWKGMDAGLKIVEREDIVKWQPENNIEDWNSLELKIVSGTVKGDGSEKILDESSLPSRPWSWFYEFKQKFEITEIESLLVSRIEIRAVKGYVNFVVFDNCGFQFTSEQCFWEVDGVPASKDKKVKKIDFKAFETKHKNSKFVKIKQLSLECDEQVCRMKFPSNSLLTAWKTELPFKEIDQAIVAKRKCSSAKDEIPF